MKRTAWVLTLLVSVCACVAAQGSSDIPCPTLTITGPLGITRPGEVIDFIAELKNPGTNNIRFNWSIEGGNIESGQGTSAIRVRRTAPVGSAPVATVKLEGLPNQCANTATETWCELLAPQAEKLDLFSEPLDSIDKVRLQRIATSVDNNPNSQLYVFAPQDVRARMTIAERLSKAIPEHNIDVSRMTFIDTGLKNSVFQFWLVPPGAKPPAKCDGCETPQAPTATAPAPANCPTLEVTGPSGVTARGAIMPFVVLVSEPRLKNLSFAWTISMGTIAEGQGTRVIKVRAPAANRTKSIVATVTVQGLPQGCRNVASDTAEIAFTGGRVVRDVYAFGQ